MQDHFFLLSTFCCTFPLILGMEEGQQMQHILAAFIINPLTAFPSPPPPHPRLHVMPPLFLLTTKQQPSVGDMNVLMLSLHVYSNIAESTF